MVEKAEAIGGLDLLSVSSVTLAELAFGIRILPEGRRKNEVLTDLEKMLGILTDVRPFSAEAAGTFSEAGATVRRAGIAFSFQGLAIASVAIAENKTLTSNDGFFEDVRRLCGLRFERWEQ